MRILHVGWGHPPEHLGMESVAYIQELCDQLALKGHSNSLLAASPVQVDGGQPFSVFHRVYSGVDVYGVANRHVQAEDLYQPLREMENPESERVFRQVVNQVKPDLIHFHNLMGLSASLLRVAGEMGVPFVVSLHDYWFICPRRRLLDNSGRVCAGPGDGERCVECILEPDEDSSPEERAFAYAARHRTIMRWLGEADMVVGVSSFVRELFMAHGLSGSKITAIHCSAATAEGLWAKTHQQSWCPSEVLTFGFIGPVARRKAPHLLVEAAAMLSDLRDRFRVLIHGTIAEPDYAQEIGERIRSLNGRLPDVEFAGDYKPEMLSEILSGFDVCVVPPMWHDSAPRTVTEALGARVPVIAAMAGGISELVGHGYNGLLFEMGNPACLAEQMRCVIENPVLLAHFRSSIMPPKPVSAHADELEAVYKSAIAKVHAPAMRKAA